MIVLGIESTCDETGCAIVRDGREILSNIVASQIDLHDTYGGVVPELACRRHVDVIIPVIDRALSEANLTLQDVDLIAVAHGPGLVGALLIGLNTAKALSLALNKPLVGVNHIEAHLYAAMMPHLDTIKFPCLGVVLSGGHSALVLMRQLGDYQLVGQTIDDAIGEAFDKAARIMGLPYPGGPQIEKLAKTGDATRYPFRIGRIKDSPYHMSFSGLKTAVLYAVKGVGGKVSGPDIVTQEDKAHIAAAFQQVALGSVVSRCVKAVQEFGCHGMVFGGGVTNNRKLRQLMADAAPNTPLYWPENGLDLDNAAMIAGLGFHRFHQKGADPLTLEPATRIAW
ncbi:MAG: tRNA (adenosine(37)-N6)-threonylcarbamoyltransferase complex transferase subunit TsaD [Chlamydiales bacterium]|nr:tRNA (adenosine(37)-N6)-threonylcarbamoyltransferase complex transferase subunit TsaD [Chlamydiales bacterium]